MIAEFTGFVRSAMNVCDAVSLRASRDISNPVTGIDGHYDTIQIIMSQIIIYRSNK